MTGVRWIGEASHDVAVVGGKAASVARLARLGLPTPPGFVITAGAFTAYLDAAGVTAEAEALVADLPDEAAEARLAELVHDHPLPAPLAAELAQALARLVEQCGDVPLAVRSSGRHEDSEASSFAGQHETVLGVRAGDVEPALRRCWASLWSSRAIAYRRAHGVEPAAPDEMAVLVQPLIDAAASAVVFTVNPVTGDRAEVVIDTARGIGEKIVSGEVTADMFVLDRVTLAPRAVEGEPAVSGDDAAALAELCLRAERSFRTPLDLEAAHDGARWWLLQARPITTTVTAPTRAPDAGRFARDPVLAAAGEGG